MDWDARRLGRHLKLRDLNILMAVARRGSMGKSASELAVSQPAVSKAIADMEHTLGVRLLDRSPRGVEPTIYARALLDHGMVAFDELQQAVRKVESLADPSLGHVRVGCSVVLAQGFVADVITRMTQRYPRVTFQLTADESGSIYRALEERKLDLAIARIFEPVPELRRRVRLAELINEAWVLPPPDTLTGSIAREGFHAARLELPVATIITSSTPARIALVASGGFLSVVPITTLPLASKKPAPKALPINLATRQRPIGVVTLKSRVLSPVAQRFTDCARGFAKSFAR